MATAYFTLVLVCNLSGVLGSLCMSCWDSPVAGLPFFSFWLVSSFITNLVLQKIVMMRANLVAENGLPRFLSVIFAVEVSVGDRWTANHLLAMFAPEPHLPQGEWCIVIRIGQASGLGGRQRAAHGIVLGGTDADAVNALRFERLGTVSRWRVRGLVRVRAGRFLLCAQRVQAIRIVQACGVLWVRTERARIVRCVVRCLFPIRGGMRCAYRGFVPAQRID